MSENPNVAKALSELTTARQLGMARALGRELGISADEECSATLGCPLDVLSKRAASDFIQRLQDMQKERAQ